MKKSFFIILLMPFFFISCENLFTTQPDSTPASTHPIEPEQSSEQKTYVNIQNNSIYPIDIYSSSEREPDSCICNDIAPNESYKITIDNNIDDIVYYVSYHVDVGADIIWNGNNSSVFVRIEKNRTVDAIVNTPTTMNIDSSYIILENASSSSLIFRKSNSELTPENKNSTILNSGETGAYRISRIDGLNFPSYKIMRSTIEIPFPQTFTELNSGKIYTLVVDDSSCTLKSVSAFNINTRRQMWTIKSRGQFADEYPIIMKNALQKGNGYYIAGTHPVHKDSLQLMHIDSYGEISVVGDAISYITPLANSAHLSVSDCTVYDFVENSDGSFVFLFENSYNDGNNNDVYYEAIALCYDFSNRNVLWSYTFPESLVFRSDSKNKLIRVSDSKFSVSGAAIDDDGMQLFFAVLSVANNNGERVVSRKVWYSENKTDFYNSGIEQMFTSSYFDGTSYYVCGYGNCDFRYDSVIHKGIIYKFTDTEDSVLPDPERVYERDRCLFFSIDGIDSDWFVCGESWNNGILKGCYFSSDMLSSEQVPVLYTDTVSGSERTNCWFNQLCCYDGMIVLCGKSCADYAGEENPLPFVVCFDNNGNKRWANHSFADYKDAKNIVPNAIGTYVLQLVNKNNNTISYVSADLLGNEIK